MKIEHFPAKFHQFLFCFVGLCRILNWTENRFCTFSFIGIKLISKHFRSSSACWKTLQKIGRICLERNKFSLFWKSLYLIRFWRVTIFDCWKNRLTLSNQYALALALNRVVKMYSFFKICYEILRNFDFFCDLNAFCYLLQN